MMEIFLKCFSNEPEIVVITHKGNFSSHRGFKVWCFTEVARMYFAGTSPLIDSRCSRLLGCSFRLNDAILKLMIKEIKLIHRNSPSL